MMAEYAGLYFAGYAIFATLTSITMFFAMRATQRREGKPMNKHLISLTSAFAVVMWIGSSFATIAYS